MRSRDDMLAEGPRVAPDPRTVVGVGDGRPVVREPGEPPARGLRALVARLAPLLVALLILWELTGLYGAGGYFEVVVIAAFALVGVWHLVRGEEAEE